MAKYMLLIFGDPAQWDAMTPEQGKAHDAAHAAFAAAAGPRIAGSEELEPTTVATTLRSDGAGGVLATDGPFAETKEQVGGFYLLEASSLDEAVKLASMLPEVQASHSGVEIRPVVDHGVRRPAAAAEERRVSRSRVGRVAAMTAGDLPVIEFAFPGPLRDQLVAAILTGEKTTTTGLLADYEHENEPLPAPGLRQVVIDSAGRPVAVIETTAVRVMRLADVDLRHAQGEGEGYASVAEWRAGHEQFWHSAEVRQDLGDPAFTVDDDTLVVAQEFRLVQD